MRRTVTRWRRPGALATSKAGTAHRLPRSFRAGIEARPAENLEREGDGADGAEQQERPADGLALVLGQAVGEQETEAGAQGCTGHGDQGKFRQGDARFS